MSDSRGSTPLRSDEISWGTYSTPQPPPSADAELISLLLAQRHEDRKTIATLRTRLHACQDEIARYARYAVQGSQRLYRKRPARPPETDPALASRELGLKV